MSKRRLRRRACSLYRSGAAGFAFAGDRPPRGRSNVGHPVGESADRELSAVARAEGWQVMRFEPLGRRFKAGVAMARAAAVGVGGAPLASGYPAREPSSTAAQELAFALEDGRTHVEHALARGP
jgi:hypothetical protein